MSSENKKEDTNGNNSYEVVDLVTLDENSDNIPAEVNLDKSEANDSNPTITWEIDEEGEEVQEIEENEESSVEAKTKISDFPFSVPNYKSAFTGYLTEKEFSMETGEHIKNDCVPVRSCFNCLGNHAISECKEKKDFNAIARNRKTILGKKSGSIRYHEDVENKYSSFRAGNISENLRQALGLRKFEAPDYIYRMRVLGYPPGWLKEAEVKRSDMSLFDGMGKPICHPEEEEGETDVRLIKYHPEKLISYPGFNVPFPDHIEDQHRQLNYPPMQEHHSKDNFLRFMTMNKASKYKRKRLRDEVPRSTNEVKMAGDMDVEEFHNLNSEIEFNPPLPKETVKPPEPPPLPPSPVPEKEDGELSEDSNEAKEARESPQDPSLTPTPSSAKRKAPEDVQSPAPGTPEIPTRASTKRQHKSSSKGFTLGASIPESITPYKMLPDSTKWSIDVSDHILFDNLPDALGTWQKMRGLVSFVKNVMQELHFEDDD